MRLTKHDKEIIKSSLRIHIETLRNLEQSSYESGRIEKGGFPLLLASYKQALAKMEAE